ncbi:MAG: DMT family transporter [Stackebrandtia sp.]
MPPLRLSAAAWSSIGLVVMWSSGFIGAELGTRTASATTLLAWRFGLIGAIAAAWLLLRRRRTGVRDLTVQAVIGLLSQVGYLYGVVRAAELGVSAATSALIAALQPIVATATAALVLSERLGWRLVAGLVIGLGGTGLVVSADLAAAATAPWWAYAFPVAAMLSLVAGTVYERRAHRHRRAPNMADGLAVQFVISGIVFTALAAATGRLTPPASREFWIAVAWVIVLSTIGGYGCYWTVASRAGVTRVSALLYLTPPATGLWAWLMFGQAIVALSLLGMVVCTAAVALIVAPRRTPRPAKPQPTEPRPVEPRPAEAQAVP